MGWAPVVRAGAPPGRHSTVLAAVVGCVTPAILVANAANNAGGNGRYGALIQVSLVFAALSTLLQLYAQKIKLGSGLPVIIGVSFAYVPTMTSYCRTGKRCQYHFWCHDHRRCGSNPRRTLYPSDQKVFRRL